MTEPPADPPAPRRAAPPRPRPPGPNQTPPQPHPRAGWTDYLRDPRSAVLAFLVSVFLIGGGRKVLQGIRARRLVAALGGSSPVVADVEAAPEHGRAGLIDLFRLLGTADRPEVRDAAGRALARLWRADELIVEEEKAVVRRGYAATWHARRTYPRALAVPIPIRVEFGVPFLVDQAGAVGPEHLVWSYRLLGTGRASLEEWTEAAPGVPSARFALIPDDFATLGPHRLALHARVRTVGLTDTWELDLPHIPFSFEFDPHLAVDALLTLPDAARATRFAGAVGLVARDEAATDSAPPLALGDDLVLRDPPSVQLRGPLPCDLAHRLGVEFEGVLGTFGAGSVVAVAADLADGLVATVPLGAVEDFSPDAIDRPGPCRLRVVLTADPSLGWGDPAVRSVWPDSITTGWVDGKIIRR